MIFWCLRCTEQSRPNRDIALPYSSARIWTSRWRALYGDGGHKEQYNYLLFSQKSLQRISAKHSGNTRCKYVDKSTGS